MEDNGYETARLKGVDVLGNVCVMLRQRGLRITSIFGQESVAMDPFPERALPSAEDHSESERAVVAAAAAAGRRGGGVARAAVVVSQAEAVVVVPAGSATAAEVIIKASYLARPPQGTSSALHVERGIYAAGDELWVFMLGAGKVGIKQVRQIHNAYIDARPMPKVVLILTREKMSSQAGDMIRRDGVHMEKFFLSEISYNITRHFLVPRHWMLSVEESAALKKKYSKLALQSRDDAISKYHGLYPGDVVGYNRVRLGSMGGIYYREVV
jgi:DNA-directed RNA polymerase subunit H (RpoH/RPB5)